MATSRFRQVSLLLLKVGVTAGLIYWLLSNADYAAIKTMSASIGPALFIAAIAVSICTFFFTALRWWLLLRHTGVNVGLRQVLPSYYLGLFFNNLLPTGVGGDVVRTVHLHRRGHDLKALTASLLVDRAIGLVVMLVIATTCAMWIPQSILDEKVRTSAFILFSACIVGTILAFSPWAGKLIKHLQTRARNTKLWRGLLDSIAICYSYRSNLPVLFFATLLSLAAQSSAIFTYVLLGRGIGIELAPISYFVIIPIVFMSAMLPISLGGLGVREGALVALLIAFGIERQLAIGLSLLYLFTLWMSTLPGALVLLWRHDGRRQAKPRQRASA